jgi:hypothetical protein
MFAVVIPKYSTNHGLKEGLLAKTTRRMPQGILNIFLASPKPATPYAWSLHRHNLTKTECTH